jgi:hypothetical protein
MSGISRLDFPYCTIEIRDNLATKDPIAMATQPQAPRLWRPLLGRRAQSVHSATSSLEGWTFGLKAPVVDFFDFDYITKFAPLEDILSGKFDEIMEEAYKYDPTGQLYLPRTTGGYSFRWIHVPANNMVGYETLFHIQMVANSPLVIPAIHILREHMIVKDFLDLVL